MDIETIKCMIDNSTWNSHEKKAIYEFVNGSSLSINGKNQLQYSINSCNDRIELQIGSEKKYNIEYINDFVLKLYNSNESFMIMPE
jgi:hypothetical protein